MAVAFLSLWQVRLLCACASSLSLSCFARALLHSRRQNQLDLPTCCPFLRPRSFECVRGTDSPLRLSTRLKNFVSGRFFVTTRECRESASTSPCALRAYLCISMAGARAPAHKIWSCSAAAATRPVGRCVRSPCSGGEWRGGRGSAWVFLQGSSTFSWAGTCTMHDVHPHPTSRPA